MIKLSEEIIVLPEMFHGLNIATLLEVIAVVGMKVHMELFSIIIGQQIIPHAELWWGLNPTL